MKSGCRERNLLTIRATLPLSYLFLGKYAESHSLNACCPINRTDISLSMEVKDIMRKKKNLYLSLKVTTSILNQNLIHIMKMLSNALSRSCQVWYIHSRKKTFGKGMIPLFPTSQYIIIIENKIKKLLQSKNNSLVLNNPQKSVK